MLFNKAYKFRIYPNEEQRVMLSKTFGCVRAIYNMMLSDKIKHYNEFGTTLNNTPAQYKSEFEWLKEVDSLALCNAQLNLQRAYQNFFRDKSIGFPKFKSKKSGHNSYTTNNQGNNIRIADGKIKLPKIGWVKVVQHRQIPDGHKIKSCTISLSPSGKYHVSILTEYEREQPNPTLDKSKAIGLDYSSPHFYVDSQGNEAGYPRFYRQGEERLAREQRKLSRMKPGSSNYNKQKVKVARMHEYISNRRKDWMHKKSKSLADEWDYVCVEDINLRGMAGSLKLGKSTNDNGFGMFREFLAYKLADRGKVLSKIGKWFPSSRTCNECGYVNKELTLSDREWTCECGAHHSRDINAAINIRDVGLQLATHNMQTQNRGMHGDSLPMLSPLGLSNRKPLPLGMGYITEIGILRGGKDMTKEEFIKDRTEYWMEPNKGVKLTKRMAKECAEDDYKIYIERWGEESLKNR